MLEHPRLPWLPTEPENVRAFEALGIERRLLPIRVYRGAVGNTRRYFALKLPVALDAERAVFAYVDPGYETTTALRSAGGAHHTASKVIGSCTHASTAWSRSRAGENCMRLATCIAASSSASEPLDSKSCVVITLPSSLIRNQRIALPPIPVLRSSDG